MHATKLKIWLLLIAVMLVIRLIMPYLLLNYVEHRINQIPEYRVVIKDLDMHIYRGSYTIKDVRLQKNQKQIPVPFFSADAIEFSIEWSALLKGRFVAEINAYQPALNFVIDPRGDNEQLSIDQEWQNAVKALFPLNIDKVVITNGSLHFKSYTSHPPFDLFLKNIQATLSNLHNKKAHVQQKLSSTLRLTANGMDNSPLKLHLQFDPFARQPTFDLDAELSNMQMKEANHFLQHYTKVKVAKGSFSLYVEAAAANGKISGYAKPLIKNLEVIKPKENASAIETLYRGAAQFFADLLKNKDTQAVATQIEIKGDIDDPDASLWSIISNLLSNAFLQAILPKIDDTVSMKDVKQ